MLRHGQPAKPEPPPTLHVIPKTEVNHTTTMETLLTPRPRMVLSAELRTRAKDLITRLEDAQGEYQAVIDRVVFSGK
jgi:hypothetical protein